MSDRSSSDSGQRRERKQRSRLEYIGIFIAIYTLLYSNQSDIFKTSLDILTVPYFRAWKAIDGLENRMSIDELIGKEKNDYPPSLAGEGAPEDEYENTIYIFVIDKSLSSKEKIKKPDWWDESIDLLRGNDYLPSGMKDPTDGEEITAIEAAQIRLFTLLVGLVPKDPTQVKDLFAVWTVGSNGKRVFPDKKTIQIPYLIGENLAEINENYVCRAIETIYESQKKLDKITDFKDLFDKIFKEYKSRIPHSDFMNKQRPVMVVTILSDLLHDVKHKKGINGDPQKVKKNWRELEDRIKELADYRIMANLIVLEKDGQVVETVMPKHKQIFYEFKKSFGWQLFTGKVIREKLNEKILFPPKFIDNSIDFYYENDRLVARYFELEANNEFRLIIDIPAKSDLTRQEGIRFPWAILGAKEKVRKRGFLSSENEKIDIDTNILESQTLRIFSNYIPPLSNDKPPLKNVTIRLIHEQNRRCYYIDIKFIKIIPLGVALLMIIMQVLTLWLTLLLLYRSIRSMWNREE